MRTIATITVLAGALLLQGCASMFGPPPMPGDSTDMVVQKFGQPKGVYPAADADQVFEYPQGPYGQTTFMARFGADGRLQSWEQVLTSEKFGTIKVDQATKADVLRTIGRPAERSRVALRNYEVWSYRYKESGVWNSMMHVHFDQDGVVRMMLNGPDPMYDDRKLFR
jgi:hypothetical protein